MLCANTRQSTAPIRTATGGRPRWLNRLHCWAFRCLSLLRLASVTPEVAGSSPVAPAPGTACECGGSRLLGPSVPPVGRWGPTSGLCPFVPIVLAEDATKAGLGAHCGHLHIDAERHFGDRDGNNRRPATAWTPGRIRERQPGDFPSRGCADCPIRPPRGGRCASWRQRAVGPYRGPQHFRR
jgi:hypothetical protein